MNAGTVLSAGTLIFLALLVLSAITAEVHPGQSFWPTAEHRADFGLGLIALVLAFCAGLLL